MSFRFLIIYTAKVFWSDARGFSERSKEFAEKLL